MKLKDLAHASILVFSLMPASVWAEAQDHDSGLFTRDYRLALGLGLSTDTESKHKEAYLIEQGKLQGATGQMSWDDGYIINLEIAASAANSWGHSIGVLYNPERTLQSGFLTSSRTGTIAELPRGLTASEILVYSNLLYRFEIFYASFGINFSRLHWHAGSSDLRVVRSSGGIAGQAAVGWKLSRNMSLEYQFVMTRFELELESRTQPDAERYRLGKSDLSTSNIVMKYNFN